jgi:CRP/FNR family transcriptional regulator, cyclic AMP receptor protein
VDEVLARAGLLQGLPPQDTAALAAQFVYLDVPRGTVVLREGEKAAGLYVVLAGKVKLSQRATNGVSLILALAGPPDTFGELSPLDPGPSTETAAAVTDARLARLPTDTLCTWVTGQPQVAWQLLRLATGRLRHSSDALADLATTDVSGRVAKQLLQLGQRFGSQDGGSLLVDHGLTQDELAELVGASVSTVNRVLSEFASRGWVQVRTRAVLVVDRDRLARRAGY